MDPVTVLKLPPSGACPGCGAGYDRVLTGLVEHGWGRPGQRPLLFEERGEPTDDGARRCLACGLSWDGTNGQVLTRYPVAAAKLAADRWLDDIEAAVLDREAGGDVSDVHRGRHEKMPGGTLRFLADDGTLVIVNVVGPMPDPNDTSETEYERECRERRP